MSTDDQTRFQSSLHRAKAGGAPSVGQWVQLPGHEIATTIASLGPDWVLIDCEHGAISESDMRVAVKAIAAASCSPIVRIAGPDPALVKRALDAGAHGIMVPMIETVAAAELIARASRYPQRDAGFPEGVRGVGGVLAPGGFGMGVRYEEYTLKANGKIMVILQIESSEGVKNCEAIARVNGIDGLFIGPNDLAASLGFLGKDHAQIPQVQEAAAKVLKAAKEAGKFAGYFCIGAAEAAKRAKEGWEFVSCGSDAIALIFWMSTEMARLKALVAPGV